ncbi:uncharacterized protein LOC124445909 [Xenia sp. Carnegie-2017]|uniref:uncharacterized protein LOC124445909 n=1 Tax=Xenia sp. Carnegie-2017 TaxID=2897299 RepID=UPI001F04F62A|nr:uncharacterized protein LOC124445909 [Xenia sp. Carnegie-2017]
MAYNTFDNTSLGAEGMNSDTSNEGEASSSTSRSELSVLPSAVRTVDSPFGKLRIPSDLEKIEIAFLTLATISTLVVIGVAIDRLANTIDESDSSLALVLIINSVFCLVYIYHGVFGERPFQLGAFMVAIVIVSIYCIIQYAIKTRTVLMVRLIILLVLGAVDLGLCLKIAYEHYTTKNLIIRTVRSANITFQNMCMNMFAFHTLLLLEFEISISLIVLVMTSGVENATHHEKVILCVGIFVGIIWLIVGFLVPRYEERTWLLAFFLLSIPQPIYAFYKIIKTGIDWKKHDKTINISIMVCAILYLVIRCLVSFFLWIVVRNFGKGLREAVYYPDDKKRSNCEEPDSKPSNKPTNSNDDYLGENVNYDVHD